MRYATTTAYTTPSDENSPAKRLADALVKHGHLEVVHNSGGVTSYRATYSGQSRWVNGQLALDLTDNTRLNHIR